MNNKVSLVYENGEYSLYINDNMINSESDIDKSIQKFRQIILDNVSVQGRPWESIESSLLEINNGIIEINKEYKTVTFGVMKYFHNSGKIFHTANGQMSPLLGGYNLFYYLLKMSIENKVKNYQDVLELCKYIVEHKGTYRINESSMIVSNPAFNYGSAEYDFNSGKINKGATIENGTFDVFKGYVMGVIK